MNDEVSIEHLTIVAGQTGTGKSSFLASPESFLDETQLPESLFDFMQKSKTYPAVMLIDFTTLSKMNRFGIHLDISHPLRVMKPYPHSRNELSEKINLTIYESWGHLNEIISRAKNVDVVTLFVNRQENFDRWLFKRCFPDDDHPPLVKNIVGIAGDSSEGSELHRKVYQNWLEFISKKKNVTQHFLEANGRDYSFISSKDFKSKINSPY